ncbi:hypothetical protein ACIQH6_01900 [Micromonospora orduensis]|uniref:hypothetical protein n=1 Tax=Micromonospora orduensis TaxID=1420891 RepID=UPI00382A6F74
MSESAQQRKPDRDVNEKDPDVLLDIPRVSVDSIRLAVDGLDADLSLRARLANLLQIDAGVRVHLRGVELDISGVHAEAQLRVRLEQLVTVLGRALDTIDNNPQIIEMLERSAGTAIDDVSRSEQQLARAAEVAASTRRSASVLDEPGRRVGAVADRAAPPSGPSGPSAGGPGPRVGGPGPAEQVRPEGGDASRSGGTEGPRPGSGGTEGPRPGSGGAEDRGAQGRQPEGQGAGRQPAGAGGGAQGPAAPPTGESRDRPGGKPASGPGPSGDGDGGQGGGLSGGAHTAAQLAEQAGETLWQAGRSVWEAIQGGVAQHRQQGRRDQ